MQLDQILPNLYLGGCPQSVVDIDALQRQFRISAVLNVQTQDDFQDWRIDWETLENYYRTVQMALQRIPIRDFDQDDLQRQLPLAVETLAQFIDRSLVTYVHCTAGVNRSPTVVIAYLHWVKQWPLAEALSHVVERRPCDPSLEAIQSAVWNGGEPGKASAPADP